MFPVGSAELLLNGTALVTERGQSITTLDPPLALHPLSSALPDEALHELTALNIKRKDNGLVLSLKVHGWLRMPSNTTATVSKRRC
jgi:hypothetical protein